MTARESLMLRTIEMVLDCEAMCSATLDPFVREHLIAASRCLMNAIAIIREEDLMSPMEYE
jgi:hypothetical protein